MKICAWCQDEFTKRPKEAYWQFDKRRFCSRTCADKGRKTTRVSDESFKARYRQVKRPDGTKVLEHRYVMERELGRRLQPSEQVHHKDHKRLNNASGNLEVLTTTEHGLRHTWRPITKTCVICCVEFMPYKTKRARAQTCGRPACKTALLVKRWEERRARG